MANPEEQKDTSETLGVPETVRGWEEFLTQEKARLKEEGMDPETVERVLSKVDEDWKAGHQESGVSGSEQPAESSTENQSESNPERESLIGKTLDLVTPEMAEVDKMEKEKEVSQKEPEQAGQETVVGKQGETTINKITHIQPRVHSPEDQQELDAAKRRLDVLYVGEEESAQPEQPVVATPEPVVESQEVESEPEITPPQSKKVEIRPAPEEPEEVVSEQPVAEASAETPEEEIPTIPESAIVHPQTKEQAFIELESLPERLLAEKNKETRKNLEKEGEELFEDLTNKNFKEEVRQRARTNAEERGYTVWKVEEYRHSTKYQQDIEKAKASLEKVQRENALRVLWNSMSPKDKKTEYIQQERLPSEYPTEAFFDMVDKKIQDSGLSPEVFYDLLNKGFMPEKDDKVGSIGRLFGYPAFKFYSLKSDAYFAFRDEKHLEQYNNEVRESLNKLNNERAVKLVEDRMRGGRKIMKREKRVAMIDVLEEAISSYQEEQRKLEEQKKMEEEMERTEEEQQVAAKETHHGRHEKTKAGNHTKKKPETKKPAEKEDETKKRRLRRKK